MFSLAELFLECSQCGRPILHNLAYFYVIEDIEEFFILFYLWEQEETVTEGNAVIIVHSNTVFDTCL